MLSRFCFGDFFIVENSSRISEGTLAIKQLFQHNKAKPETLKSLTICVFKGNFLKRISNFPLFCIKQCLPPTKLIGFVEKVPS